MDKWKCEMCGREMQRMNWTVMTCAKCRCEQVVDVEGEVQWLKMNVVEHHNNKLQGELRYEKV
jgi:hypothetical protein